MNKKALILGLAALMLSACGGTQGESTTSAEEGAEETTSSVEEEPDEGEGEGDGDIEVTINVDFRNIAENAGYNYGQNPATLFGYFEGVSDLIGTEPTVENVYAQYATEESDVRLTMGSGKKTGKIVMELLKPVKALRVTASDYFKFYTDGTGTPGASHDNASVVVNGVSQALTHVEGAVESTLEEKEFVFAEPATEITLESASDPASGDESYRYFLYNLEFVVA